MKFTSLLLTSALCFAPLLALTACQNSSPEAPQTKAAQAVEPASIFTASHIKSAADGVADWQIEHFDDFDDYIPTFQERTRDEPKGWIKGTFFKGLIDYAQQTGDQDYKNWLKDFAEAQNYELDKRIYHADDHVVGQYYMALYDEYKDPAMIAHTQETFDKILANPSTVSLDFGPEGTLEGYYKECLTRWCWADALFMSPPVWTKLTKITGEQKYLDYSDSEFWITTDYLFDEEYDLFLRDSRYFTEREPTGEKVFWSRGNGWVFAGITDVVDDLPKDYKSSDRYMQLYKDMAASLIKVQSDNGYWPVSLAAGQHHPVPESSGTAFFVAGLAWGVANGTLDAETYMPHIKKGWAALDASITDEGMIGWVQQVGYAPDKVAANETQFYGAGAYLLAAAGMLELIEQGYDL